MDADVIAEHGQGIAPDVAGGRGVVLAECYGHLNRRRSPGEPHDLHKQSFILPPRFRSSGLVALRSGSALSRATWHLLSRATWHASGPSSLAPLRTGVLDDYLHGHVLLY